MKANTSILFARMTRAKATMKRVERNAVNDTAFVLRGETPEFLFDAIDKPEKFTYSKNVALVSKSTGKEPGGARARVYLARIQAEYLNAIEFGGTEKLMNIPVHSSARSASGGVRTMFRRNKSSLETLLRKRTKVKNKNGTTRQVGRYFVGKPRGLRATATAGIWERVRNNKGVRQMTAFKERVNYRKRIDIIGFWKSRGNEALREKVQEQLRHPSNKL